MAKLKLMTKKTSETEEQTVEETKVAPKVVAQKFAAMKTAVLARASVLVEEAQLKARLAELATLKKAADMAVMEYAEQLENTGELIGSETRLVDLDTCTVDIGKRAKSREITPEGKEKLVELLSEEDFFKLAGFKLGDLDAYLTPSQVKSVVVESEGARSVTIKNKG